MSVTVVADAGSCFCGRRDFALELVRVAKEIGCSVVKFQLFSGEEFTKHGNIEMPKDLFRECYLEGKRLGIPVTASVFDDSWASFLSTFEVPFVKFAYSRRLDLAKIQGLLNIGRKVVVSTNPMDAWALPRHPNLVKLFCPQVPESTYPNFMEIDFEGLIPERFDGFSDHSCGTKQTLKAVKHGATWIERHLRLTDEECDKVPDGKFALLPRQLENLIKEIKP